jgi:hypothetical protein
MDNIVDFDHLKKLNTGYWNHFRYAFYLSLLSICAGIVGMIHTVLPFLFPFVPIKIINHIKMEFDHETYDGNKK